MLALSHAERKRMIQDRPQEEKEADRREEQADPAMKAGAPRERRVEIKKFLN